MMNLGIVVTDKAYGAPVIELIRAAHTRGWDIRCFLTDSGVNLLAETTFRALAENGTASIAACELSLERYGEDVPGLQNLPGQVIIGGQYQDAELVHNTDRVLVF